MTPAGADSQAPAVPIDGASTTEAPVSTSHPTATGPTHDYRDLCIEDQAYELAIMGEVCASYRFCWLMSLGALATVTKERDRLRLRCFTLIDQQRRTATAIHPRRDAAGRARGGA
jgi:hypothetical protein